MNQATYQLAEGSGKLAAMAFAPVVLLSAYLCVRTESNGGTAFMIVDAVTVSGICLSLLLSLAALFWWGECGHGWMDRFLAAIACLPFAALLFRLDPTGIGPIFL